MVRHSLVQKIVKAYERYNEAIGANRQLSLRLAEQAADAGQSRTRPFSIPGRLKTAPCLTDHSTSLLFRHPSPHVRTTRSAPVL